MLRLPLGIGHAVDDLPPLILGRTPRLSNPIAQAVAAETSQPHQVHILRIGPVLQVAHQTPEGSGGNRVVKCFNHHHKTPARGIHRKADRR